MPPIRRILVLVALSALAAPTAATAAPRPAKAVVLDVVRVDLRGDLSATYAGAPESFTYEGSARYESTVDEQGSLRIPARRPLPVALVIKPIEYNGISEVTLANETGRWSCGIPMPDRFAPDALTAAVSFTKTRARFHWILANPPYRCAVSSGAPSWWTIPAMPSRGAVSEYPLAKLRGLEKGKSLKVPVRLSHDFEQSGTYSDYRWNGYVELERAR